MYGQKASGAQSKAGSVNGGRSSIVQRLVWTHVVVLVDVVLDSDPEFSALFKIFCKRANRDVQMISGARGRACG